MDGNVAMFISWLEGVRGSNTGVSLFGEEGIHTVAFKDNGSTHLSLFLSGERNGANTVKFNRVCVKGMQKFFVLFLQFFFKFETIWKLKSKQKIRVYSEVYVSIFVYLMYIHLMYIYVIYYLYTYVFINIYKYICIYVSISVHLHNPTTPIPARYHRNSPALLWQPPNGLPASALAPPFRPFSTAQLKRD